MEPAHLKDRAVIALEGGEARDFLQGLVTNDIQRLAPQTGLYAALLTPQGKILFDFLVTEGDGAILLDCPSDRADALAKRLTMYRLRAKIGIAVRPQLSVYVGLSGRPAERAVTFTDPRLAALGPRSIGASAEMPDFLEGPATYHAERLTLGVPEGADFASDKIFALDAGLDELHGVAFDKGCYVGQELTARMKHRGTARKRILPIRADSMLPPAGTAVASDTLEVGEMVSTYGTRGFALVRLDRLDEAKASLTAGTLPVTLTRPAWLDT
ncbi:MAG: folate-binding protein [Pseudomonadota bacterium]